MPRVSFEVRDVYRLLDRAAYSISGGRLKLGSDLWATENELAVAAKRLNPLNAPLCDAPEPLTIADISLLLADGKPLPAEHEKHPECAAMYQRLGQSTPSPDVRERWRQRHGGRIGGAVASGEFSPAVKSEEE